MVSLIVLWLASSVAAVLTLLVVLGARSSYLIRERRLNSLALVTEAAVSSGGAAAARLRAAAALRADVSLDAERVALWVQGALVNLHQYHGRGQDGVLIEQLEPLLNPLVEWAAMRRTSYSFKRLPVPTFDAELNGVGGNTVTRHWDRSTTVGKKLA